MLRRLFGRLCRNCLHDPVPVRDHPAIEALKRSGHQLDRMIESLDDELDGRSSGVWTRDMIAGVYRPPDRDEVTG